DQRVLGGRAGEQEVLKEQIEPALGLRGPQRRYARLRAEDALERRDKVDDQLPVEAHGSLYALFPAGERLLGLAQDLPNELAKGLRHGCIRDGVAKLIEFACNEVATLPGDRFVDLVDQRRFADAGVASDEEQLRGAPPDAVMGGKQLTDLGVAAV